MAEVKIEKLANEFEAAISIWLMSVFFDDATGNRIKAIELSESMI